MVKRIIEGWSIDEIILKLPLVNIKLKAPALKNNEPQATVESAAAFEGIQGVKVALKSFNGSFVTAALNRNGELIANSPNVAGWEIFELFRLADGKVAFRAFNRKFVGAKLHEHCQLAADRPNVQGWEAFSLEHLPDGKVALQAFNGSYVSAYLNRNGELVADRPEARGWEAFSLVLAA
jgi:hypothetical protein